MAPPAVLYMLDIGWAAGTEITRPHGRILRAEKGQTTPTVILEGEDAPDGIAVCHSNRRLYWTCMGIPDQQDGSVRSCNLDGVLPKGAVHTPKQLCIDETGRTKALLL